MKRLTAFAVVLLVPFSLLAATLSDPAVDGYNARVGTQTFSGLYSFTSDTLLVETADAIRGFGSDAIKFYLGPNYSDKYGINLGPNITNLLTLARDEPSVHHVLDMPFRHYIAWVYPLSYWWPFDGYSASERANEYREFYDLTRYVLTNYNNSGKTFYFGHWEGDGYLNVEVNGKAWATNPSPTAVQGFIDCLNNRQKAIDDAKRDTIFTNVNVFCYAEANRVRDAMRNGPTNNVRMINAVIPYVTNLDCISYSSYDAQNLSTTDLYTTLDYMQSLFPTNKAGAVPSGRMWIGEYGWGKSQTPAQQEPTTRAYIQRLLNYGNGMLRFILFWEMYDNETNSDGSFANFYLIDPTGTKVPCWYLHQRFINSARLLAARFKEASGRLPTDAEFVSLVSPLLNQSLPAPVDISVTNGGATLLTNSSVIVSGTVAQGLYGDEEAGVWVYYGRQDGGANSGAWESARFMGANTHFNPTALSVTLNNLLPNTNYFYRLYAANSTTSAWAASSAVFSTATLRPSDFGSRLRIGFTGYNRGETLSNFPVLVNLSSALPGFSYRQFASPTGGDLRFTDAGGVELLAHEIDEWETNGVSHIWVQVPSLSGTNDFIWAYWGNPLDVHPPSWTTNGLVWSPTHRLVWHLKESSLPYADSAQQYPAVSGAPPASTAGEVGRGGAYNGTSQFLNAGGVALGNAFTVSAWVRLDAAASNIQPIWANKAGGWNANGVALFVNSYQTTDQMLRLETGDGINGFAAATAAGAVSFGQWHLLTAVVDRSAGWARLFVDGTDATQSSLVFTNFGNTANLCLGQITNGSYHFKGAMDEVRIESLARSSNWVWASWMTVAANPALQGYSSVSQQSPALTLTAASGTDLVLAWPGSGVGFGVSVATNLAPPVTWTPAPNPPAWTNNRWEVALPHVADGALFYRLQSQ